MSNEHLVEFTLDHVPTGHFVKTEKKNTHKHVSTYLVSNLTELQLKIHLRVKITYIYSYQSEEFNLVKFTHTQNLMIKVTAPRYFPMF